MDVINFVLYIFTQVRVWAPVTLMSLTLQYIWQHAFGVYHYLASLSVCVVVVVVPTSTVVELSG